MANKTIRLLKTGATFGPNEWVLMPDSTRDRTCQVCPSHEPLPAMYDARLPSGQWAYICATHFGTLGCRVGLGRGQRLVLESEKYEVIVP